MTYNNSNPAEYAVAVTPDDMQTIPTSRAIYVGVGGDVKVKMSSEATSSVLFKNVPGGTILPIRAVMVYKTDTTATNLVNLY